MYLYYFITDKSHHYYIVGLSPPLDHLLSDLVYPCQVGGEPGVKAREVSPPAAVARGNHSNRCPGESPGVLVEESPATVSPAGISPSQGVAGTQQTLTLQRTF